MTGEQLREVRETLGMSVVEFARWLGYRGSDRNVSLTIRRYERGDRPVPFDLSPTDVSTELRRRGGVDKLTIREK